MPDTFALREYIDGISRELADNLRRGTELRKNRLEALNPGAFAQNISSRIVYEQVNADRITEGMTESLRQRLDNARERIEILKVFIETSNPKAILSRGYSVVTDSEGNILNSTKNLKKGQLVGIETSEGTAEAEIVRI